MTGEPTTGSMTKKALSVAWPAMAESFFVAPADQLSWFMMVSLRFRQGKWVDLKI